VSVCIIGGGNQSNRRKPATCSMSLNFFFTYYWIEYTFPWAGYVVTTLVVMSTNCIGSCKSNYHMITTTTAHVQLGPNRLFIFLYSIILYIYLWKNLCFYYYRKIFEVLHSKLPEGENFSFPSFLGNCLCDLDLSHNNLNQVHLSVSNLALLHCLDISQYVYIYSQTCLCSHLY
jgi:hypothetical protein